MLKSNVMVIIAICAFVQSVTVKPRCPEECTMDKEKFCKTHDRHDQKACNITESCKINPSWFANPIIGFGRPRPMEGPARSKNLICPQDCIEWSRFFCVNYTDRIVECDMIDYCLDVLTKNPRLGR